MEANKYLKLKETITELGYGDEIRWQQNVEPVDNEVLFFIETCWVILNSGMKEQIARKIWDRIKTAWHEGKETGTVFKHSGKVKAIDYVKANKERIFCDYMVAEDKIEFLKTIPFIGNITCYHLAKNLGHDCIKPDRHLVRIANEHGTTPNEMCDILSMQTGDKKCVVDIVIWRAANLGLC